MSEIVLQVLQNELPALPEALEVLFSYWRKKKIFFIFVFIFLISFLQAAASQIFWNEKFFPGSTERGSFAFIATSTPISDCAGTVSFWNFKPYPRIFINATYVGKTIMNWKIY